MHDARCDKATLLVCARPQNNRLSKWQSSQHRNLLAEMVHSLACLLWAAQQTRPSVAGGGGITAQPMPVTAGLNCTGTPCAPAPCHPLPSLACAAAALC